MKTRMFLTLPAAFLALGLASVPAFAQKGALLTLVETSGNVVATWSGEFDFTQITQYGQINESGRFIASSPSYLFSAGSTTGLSGITYTWAPTYNLGASTGPDTGIFSAPLSQIYANSHSGGLIGAVIGTSPNLIFLESTYTSGIPLTSSSTWNGTTFAGLNFNPGTYVWNYGANNSTFTLKVGSGGGTTGGGGGVPEPGEWAAMGVLGAGLTGLVIRKRKKA